MTATAASTPTRVCPSAPVFQKRMRKAGVSARAMHSSTATFLKNFQRFARVENEPFMKL